MTVAEVQRRVEAFLTGQMVEAPRSIEYRLPPFNAEPGVTSLADAARGKVMSATSSALLTAPTSLQRSAMPLSCRSVNSRAIVTP